MSITQNEILLMAEVVSREKDLDKEIVFGAIEAALATATQKLKGGDIKVRVRIDRDSGDYESFRVQEVIDDEAELEFPDRQIPLSEARKRRPDIEIGGLLDVGEAPMEKVDFGRIEAQSAKQVIMQKVREAVREQVREHYQGRIGDLFSGTVKRVERNHIIVEVQDEVRAEALLPRSGMIPTERLRAGDHIKVLLQDLDAEARGPQLVLTRVSPEFLIKLFRREVPEIDEGKVEICGAARDPGLRAKIAVRSNDEKVDPVAACIGMRGLRVQSVSNEIDKERVDIIVWSDSPAEYVMSALSPAEVESIYMDEDLKSMDVVVTEENKAKAIGAKGQNVRLASLLTGWEINLMNDQESVEKQEGEQKSLAENFMRQLDIDESVASILVQEGFSSLEEIAYVPRQELLDIAEFNEELVDELRNRAQDTLLTNAIASQDEREPEADLLAMEGMDEETARALAGGGVRTLSDLADCAVDEVLDIVDLDRDRASALIMTARAPLFK